MDSNPFLDCFEAVRLRGYLLVILFVSCSCFSGKEKKIKTIIGKFGIYHDQSYSPTTLKRVSSEEGLNMCELILKGIKNTYGSTFSKLEGFLEVVRKVDESTAYAPRKQLDQLLTSCKDDLNGLHQAHQLISTSSSNYDSIRSKELTKLVSRARGSSALEANYKTQFKNQVGVDAALTWDGSVNAKADWDRSKQRFLVDGVLKKITDFHTRCGACIEEAVTQQNHEDQERINKKLSESMEDFLQKVKDWEG